MPNTPRRRTDPLLQQLRNASERLAREQINYQINYHRDQRVSYITPQVASMSSPSSGETIFPQGTPGRDEVFVDWRNVVDNPHIREYRYQNQRNGRVRSQYVESVPVEQIGATPSTETNPNIDELIFDNLSNLASVNVPVNTQNSPIDFVREDEVTRGETAIPNPTPFIAATVPVTWTSNNHFFGTYSRPHLCEFPEVKESHREHYQGILDFYKEAYPDIYSNLEQQYAENGCTKMLCFIEALIIEVNRVRARAARERDRGSQRILYEGANGV